MTGGLHLGPVGGRIVTETLIGLLRADPTSYLNTHPRFRPFLGTDLKLGPSPNPNITGNRHYTRAHFLHYAGVVTPARIGDHVTPANLEIREGLRCSASGPGGCVRPAAPPAPPARGRGRA